MTREEEVKDLLIQLMAAVKPEDLSLEDEAKLRYIVDTLSITHNEIPQELEDRLKQIPDKKQRFIAAALEVGAMDQESLDSLVEALQAKGLL